MAGAIGVSVLRQQAIRTGVPASLVHQILPRDSKLPKHQLFLYEHCPYCVRARMIFGLKQVPVTLQYLGSRDESTPVNLVGAKQVPILLSTEGQVMSESMKIVQYIDRNFAGASVLNPSAKREDINDWIAKADGFIRKLTFPRFHETRIFPEFAQAEGCAYFQKKKEAKLGSFDKLKQETPIFKLEMEQLLENLESLLTSDHSVNEVLSYDDIDLFGRLRGLTIVRDLKWNSKVRTYLEYLSESTDIPLLDEYSR